MSAADWEADRAAWQLTPREYAHYLGRLSDYHAGLARRFADKADDNFRMAARNFRIAEVFLALALILTLVQAVIL